MKCSLLPEDKPVKPESNPSDAPRRSDIPTELDRGKRHAHMACPPRPTADDPIPADHPIGKLNAVVDMCTARTRAATKDRVTRRPRRSASAYHVVTAPQHNTTAGVLLGHQIEPERGIEPRTYSLRVNRSAD